MKKILLSLSFLCLSAIIYPQDFFRGDFDNGKSNLIFMNPTVGNLEVINFLIGQKLLDINTDKVNIVGVYHATQEYDFAKTDSLIETGRFDGYFLYEIRGDLTEESLFRENDCTNDFKLIFNNSIGII